MLTPIFFLTGEKTDEVTASAEFQLGGKLATCKAIQLRGSW